MLDEESASLDHGSNREKIGWKEIVAAAKRLQIEPCALQAVCTVESSGQGFLPSGKPKILFEGHIFWRELAKRRYQPVFPPFFIGNGRQCTIWGERKNMPGSRRQ